MDAGGETLINQRDNKTHRLHSMLCILILFSLSINTVISSRLLSVSSKLSLTFVPNKLSHKLSVNHDQWNHNWKLPERPTNTDCWKPSALGLSPNSLAPIAHFSSPSLSSSSHPPLTMKRQLISYKIIFISSQGSKFTRSHFPFLFSSFLITLPSIACWNIRSWTVHIHNLVSQIEHLNPKLCSPEKYQREGGHQCLRQDTGRDNFTS